MHDGKDISGRCGEEGLRARELDDDGRGRGEMEHIRLRRSVIQIIFVRRYSR